MTADQYTELIDFLARKFEAIDRRFNAIEQRFDAIEHRMAALEVSHEAMRNDIRALAEGQAVITARMDRFEAESRERFDAIEVRMDRIEVRFGRFDVDFGTVILDHGRRLRTLEGSGGS
jgi:hypothetical protein